MDKLYKIWGMKQPTLMNSFELQSAVHERKDGLSDYDFVKIEQMEFLAKNVRKREDINWVGS